HPEAVAGLEVDRDETAVAELAGAGEVLFLAARQRDFGDDRDADAVLAALEQRELPVHDHVADVELHAVVGRAGAALRHLFELGDVEGHAQTECEAIDDADRAGELRRAELLDQLREAILAVLELDLERILGVVAPEPE